MSKNLRTKKVLVGGALSLAALLVFSGAALAQPAVASTPGVAGGSVPAVDGGPGAPPGADGSAGPEVPPGPVIPPVPAGAPQPSPNPRDFDGVWYHQGALEHQIRSDMFGYKTPYNEAGKKVKDRRVQSLRDGMPFINASSRCLPMGQPWQMDLNMPFHLFQSKDRFDLIFEEYHGHVQIVMEGVKPPPPGYMGQSIARWDGDTLVVETSGFIEGIWLDTIGTPASTNAKLTQRIRKVKSDNWYLEVVFTLDDPTYYTRPWSWVRDYVWRPDMALFREYNCEIQTGAENGVDASLVPEPQD